jgi:hypothetical protein
MKNRYAVLGFVAAAATLIVAPTLRAQDGQFGGQGGGSGYGISEMAVDERYVYVLSGSTILRIDKRTGANAGTLAVGTGASWNPSGTLSGGGGGTGGGTTTGGTTTGGTTTGATATGTTAR